MVELKQGITIEADFLPEPATVIFFQNIGISYKIYAKGENTLLSHTFKIRNPIVTPEERI